MTYHIPSDPSAPAQETWAVLYSHEYGTDVTLYSSEEAAERGAVKIIVNFYNEMEDDSFDRDAQSRLAELVSDRDWKAVIVWFNRRSDTETVLIEKPAFYLESEVEIPTFEITSEETEEENEE